jgi:hypothetical protein
MSVAEAVVIGLTDVPMSKTPPVGTVIVPPTTVSIELTVRLNFSLPLTVVVDA